jgi:hypothetical protein
MLLLQEGETGKEWDPLTSNALSKIGAHYKYIRLIQSDLCFADVTVADISYVFVIKKVNTALTCFRFRTVTDLWPLELRISGKNHVKDVE